jgi:hypothetical protein
MSCDEAVVAVLPANKCPISVTFVLAPVTNKPPAVELALLLENTHSVDETVDASILIAPPHFALLFVKVHFINVTDDAFRLIAPPFANASFPLNVHELITKLDAPATWIPPPREYVDRLFETVHPFIVNDAWPDTNIDPPSPPVPLPKRVRNAPSADAQDPFATSLNEYSVDTSPALNS